MLDGVNATVFRSTRLSGTHSGIRSGIAKDIDERIASTAHPEEPAAANVSRNIHLHCTTELVE